MEEKSTKFLGENPRNNKNNVNKRKKQIFLFSFEVFPMRICVRSEKMSKVQLYVMCGISGKVV